MRIPTKNTSLLGRKLAKEMGFIPLPLAPIWIRWVPGVGWRKSAKINGIFTITATVLAHSIERLTTELAVAASISGTGPKIRKIK